jgi:cytochrome c-type biogenesis protein CcmH/NrfG
LGVYLTSVLLGAPFIRPLTRLAAARALSSGNKARDEKRWGEAAEAYAKYLRLRPDAAVIWVQCGHCLKEIGKAEEAEKAYLKGQELDPENPDTLLHLGRLKLAMNDDAMAGRYFERAAAFPSPSWDATRELQSLRARPADRALSLANKARDERRWAEAIEAYQTFLALKPDAANIWVQLGHCLKENGRAEEAEKAYLKAQDLNPENADTLLHLGRPERDENSWLEEIKSHAASLGRGPDAAKVWVQLGHRLKEIGKAEEAEKAYLKGQELDPENPDTLLHLGRLKLAMSDDAMAGRYFERAAAFPSPSWDATRELQSLRARPADRALSLADKARDERR